MNDKATHTATGALRLILDGAMTIYNAVETKARLLEALENATILELDLSQVEEIDTAGFQLLILTKRESMKENKILRLVGHSPAVREMIGFYNMDAYFGDPLVIPADH
ncbi:MAG: STAS domain-containing protein [Rhodocyclaceae bacterium]|nr:STAS domain-containing protein [Rhodocyclaceae bacterium]